MDIKSIVKASMSGASTNSGGRAVVLYLDPDMIHRTGDRRCLLPVLAIEGLAEYAEFLPRYCDMIAGWFGEDEEQAQLKVDEVNHEIGFDPQAAIDLVGASMAAAAEQDHRENLKMKR
jgi:hypothetical protein